MKFNVKEIIAMKEKSEKLAIDAQKGAKKIVRHYYRWSSNCDDWKPKENMKKELKSYRLWHNRMGRKYKKMDEHAKFMKSVFEGVFRVPRKSRVLLAKGRGKAKYFSMTEDGLRVNECGWLAEPSAGDIDCQLELSHNCPAKWKKYYVFLRELIPVSKIFSAVDGGGGEFVKNMPIMDADTWGDGLRDTALRIEERAEVSMSDGVEIEGVEVDDKNVNGAITYVMNKEIVEEIMKKREAQVDELIKKMDIAKKELSEKHKRALLIASC